VRRVRIFQSREKEREYMEKGPVFGLNIGELLTIYDRDSRSWKMSECLFTGDYARYSGPLRKSGMMRNGRIYEQATWVPRTKGKESGLWPTPTTQEVESECELNERGRRIQKTGDGSRGLNLARKVKFLTPHSNCHTGPGRRGDGGENLQTAVKNFPTPRANDYKGGLRHDTESNRKEVDFYLPDKINKMEGTTGQLNPQFVEWLMGYPLNYTDTRDDLRLSLIRE